MLALVRSLVRSVWRLPAADARPSGRLDLAFVTGVTVAKVVMG